MKEWGPGAALTAVYLSHPILCAAEPLMGSSLLEETSVPSKNLVSVNPQPSLGGESLNLPNTNSILGVDDGKNFSSPLFGESGLPLETKEWDCLQNGGSNFISCE